MKHITKKHAEELLGDHAHEIAYSIKDCENMGWKTTSWQIASRRCTIYAKKFGQRWRFQVCFD